MKRNRSPSLISKVMIARFASALFVAIILPFGCQSPDDQEMTAYLNMRCKYIIGCINLEEIRERLKFESKTVLRRESGKFSPIDVAFLNSCLKLIHNPSKKASAQLSYGRSEYRRFRVDQHDEIVVEVKLRESATGLALPSISVLSTSKDFIADLFIDIISQIETNPFFYIDSPQYLAPSPASLTCLLEHRDCKYWIHFCVSSNTDDDKEYYLRLEPWEFEYDNPFGINLWKARSSDSAVAFWIARGLD